jgi:hypothetical protein
MQWSTVRPRIPFIGPAVVGYDRSLGGGLVARWSFHGVNYQRGTRREGGGADPFRGRRGGSVSRGVEGMARAGRWRWCSVLLEEGERELGHCWAKRPNGPMICC